MALADQKCVPCKGGVPPLPRAMAEKLREELDPGWTLTHEGRRVERTFRFPDFAAALAFANTLGQLAEREDHHPDLHIGWGRLTVELWTHKIDGLTESDFYFAAKTDKLYTA